MKRGAGETEWEAAERHQCRCIWLTGQKGLTEYEAAVMIIQEAKQLVQTDVGLMGVQWNPTEIHPTNPTTALHKSTPGSAGKRTTPLSSGRGRHSRGKQRLVSSRRRSSTGSDKADTSSNGKAYASFVSPPHSLRTSRTAIISPPPSLLNSTPNHRQSENHSVPVVSNHSLPGVSTVTEKQVLPQKGLDENLVKPSTSGVNAIKKGCDTPIARPTQSGMRCVRSRTKRVPSPSPTTRITQSHSSDKVTLPNDHNQLQMSASFKADNVHDNKRSKKTGASYNSDSKLGSTALEHATLGPGNQESQQQGHNQIVQVDVHVGPTGPFQHLADSPEVGVRINLPVTSEAKQEKVTEQSPQLHTEQLEVTEQSTHPHTELEEVHTEQVEVTEQSTHHKTEQEEATELSPQLHTEREKAMEQSPQLHTEQEEATEQLPQLHTEHKKPTEQSPQLYTEQEENFEDSFMLDTQTMRLMANMTSLATAQSHQSCEHNVQTVSQQTTPQAKPHQVPMCTALVTEDSTKVVPKEAALANDGAPKGVSMEVAVANGSAPKGLLMEVAVAYEGAPKETKDSRGSGQLDHSHSPLMFSEDVNMSFDGAMYEYMREFSTQNHKIATSASPVFTRDREQATTAQPRLPSKEEHLVCGTNPKIVSTVSNYDLVITNPGIVESEGLLPARPHKGSEGSVRPHEGFECSVIPHKGSKGSVRHHKGSEGLVRPHKGSEGSVRPHEGSAGSVKPHKGSEGSVRPHEGSEGSVRPHKGSEDSVRPHEGSEGSVRPHKGSDGSVRPHKGSEGSVKHQKRSERLGPARNHKESEGLRNTRDHKEFEILPSARQPEESEDLVPASNYERLLFCEHAAELSDDDILDEHVPLPFENNNVRIGQNSDMSAKKRNVTYAGLDEDMQIALNMSESFMCSALTPKPAISYFNKSKSRSKSTHSNKVSKLDVSSTVTTAHDNAFTFSMIEKELLDCEMDIPTQNSKLTNETNEEHMGNLVMGGASSKSVFSNIIQSPKQLKVSHCQKRKHSENAKQGEVYIPAKQNRKSRPVSASGVGEEKSTSLNDSGGGDYVPPTPPDNKPDTPNRGHRQKNTPNSKHQTPKTHRSRLLRSTGKTKVQTCALTNPRTVSKGSEARKSAMSEAANNVVVASAVAENIVTSAAVGKTVTSAAAEKTVTSVAAGKTVTSATASKTVTSAAVVKIVTSATADKRVTSAASSKTVTSVAAGKTVTSAAAGKTITSVAAGKTVTSAAADKTVILTATDKTAVTSAAADKIVTSAAADKSVEGVSSSLCCTNQSFTIIDVAANKLLFDHFIAEWCTKEMYAISVACHKQAAQSGHAALIGANHHIGECYILLGNYLIKKSL